MNIETTKEKILDAAETSQEAKKALEKLFPDVFEDAKYLNLQPLVSALADYNFKNIAREAGFTAGTVMQVRNYGMYENKAFSLDFNYDWEITNDECGYPVLLPTRKI